MVRSMSQKRSEISSGVSVGTSKTNTTLTLSNILASGTCKYIENKNEDTEGERDVKWPTNGFSSDNREVERF